jgi:type II secretory pathway pseudopilin PulG
MKLPFCQRRQGVALVVVLVFCVVLLLSVGVLFFQTRSQRGVHENLQQQMRALTAARGILQLAVYKFRVLPTDFYRVAIPPAPPGSPLRDAWMNDFDPDVPGSLAKELGDAYRLADGCSYRVGIERFELVDREEFGYRKDFVLIRAYGECDGFRRTIDELIEIEVTHD